MLNLLAHASKQNYRTLPEVLLAGGDDASSFVDITGTGNSLLLCSLPKRSLSVRTVL